MKRRQISEALQKATAGAVSTPWSQRVAVNKLHIKNTWQLVRKHGPMQLQTILHIQEHHIQLDHPFYVDRKVISRGGSRDRVRGRSLSSEICWQLNLATNIILLNKRYIINGTVCRRVRLLFNDLLLFRGVCLPARASLPRNLAARIRRLSVLLLGYRLRLVKRQFSPPNYF